MKVTKGFVIVAFVDIKDTIINNHLQLHLGEGIRYCSLSSGTEGH